MIGRDTESLVPGFGRPGTTEHELLDFMQMKRRFYSPVEIFPGSGVPLLDILKQIVVKTGRGFGFWRLVNLGTRIIPSWRNLKVVGPDGHPFFLDLQDYGFGLVISGFMTSEIAPIISALPADSVILDVGANIGAWTRLFAAQARAGMVYAFEPSPKNAEVLRRNVQGYANIQIYQEALSHRTGTVYLAEQKQAGLRHITESGAHGSVPVASRTLDDWVARNGVPRLDCIKVDVEGFEENVLLHGEKTLQRFSPVICFEYIPQLAKSRSLYRGERLFSYLAGLNYQIFRLDKNGVLFSDINGAEDWTNDYIALSPKWKWLAYAERNLAKPH